MKSLQQSLDEANAKLAMYEEKDMVCSHVEFEKAMEMRECFEILGRHINLKHRMRLRDAVREAMQLLESEKKTKIEIEQFIADVTCLPGCNAYFHEDNCPVASPVVAWRKLQDKLAEAQDELEDWKTSCREAQALHKTAHERYERAERLLNEFYESVNKKLLGGYVSICPFCSPDMTSTDSAQHEEDCCYKLIGAFVERRKETK